MQKQLSNLYLIKSVIAKINICMPYLLTSVTFDLLANFSSAVAREQLQIRSRANLHPVEFFLGT
jgi:hypothetical protein